MHNTPSSFTALNNGILLTLMNQRHEALFSLYRPLSAPAGYRRRGCDLIQFTARQETVLFTAETNEDAQYLLDTLLREIMAMTRLRRMKRFTWIWGLSLVALFFFPQPLQRLTACTPLLLALAAAVSLSLDYGHKTLMHWQQTRRDRAARLTFTEGV